MIGFIFKGILKDENEFNFDYDQIKLYYQILLPLYKANLEFEKTETSIAKVIPLINLITKGVLERMELTDQPKAFIDSLIKNIKKKFHYELNSKIYQAATILDIEKIKSWNKGFGKEAFNLGFEALEDAILLLQNQDEIKASQSQASQNLLIGSEIEKDVCDIFAEFQKSKSTENLNKETKPILDDIKKEKDLFLTLINESKPSSTAYFWNLNKKSLPIIAKLAKRFYFFINTFFLFKYEFMFFLLLRLLNIPASSAFIERYFSICGIVCNKRNQNMRGDLTIIRSLLKANTLILEEMS